MIPRLARCAAAAAAAAVALAACGGDSPTSSPTAPAASPAPVFNQADVDFAAHMSQHHGQALAMAEIAEDRGRSRAVRALAARIASARAPEVDRFGEWLGAWGAAGGQMPPHGIGDDHAGPGMLDQAEVDRLRVVPRAAFDRLFLKLMVRHHRGGHALTGPEIATGRHTDAVRLARQIRTAAVAGIAEMVALDKSLAP